MHLLSNNRNIDFCNELELLEIEDLKDNYVKISRELDQSIMEGNYKQIAEIKKSVNDRFYNNYLETFTSAIRFQIARSAEKSYDSLSIINALQILMMNNQEDLYTFIQYEVENIENREFDWKLGNDRVNFIPINKDKISIPAYKIISDTMTLAIELEKII